MSAQNMSAAKNACETATIVTKILYNLFCTPSSANVAEKKPRITPFKTSPLAVPQHSVALHVHNSSCNIVPRQMLTALTRHERQLQHERMQLNNSQLLRSSTSMNTPALMQSLRLFPKSAAWFRDRRWYPHPPSSAVCSPDLTRPVPKVRRPQRAAHFRAPCALAPSSNVRPSEIPHSRPSDASPSPS